MSIFKHIRFPRFRRLRKCLHPSTSSIDDTEQEGSIAEESMYSTISFPETEYSDVSIDVAQRWDDEYCGTPSVQGLGYENFLDYLASKDLTLVFFYHGGHDTSRARNEFVEAAHKTRSYNHSFAAVDCLQEPAVCNRENVSNYPYLKLYSHGKYVGFQNDPSNLTASCINKWLESFKVC